MKSKNQIIVRCKAADFNPRLTARAKLSHSRAQNIYACEHTLSCFITIKCQIDEEKWPFAFNSIKHLKNIATKVVST